MYHSVQSMRANAWYFNARHILQQLASPINSSELALAESAITLATTLDPKHPHYWHFYGYIKMRSISALITDQSELNNVPAKLAYVQAEQAFLKSIELRQAWAETWIALAQLASYQHGLNEQVFFNIQRAKQVGPFQLNVHLGIIQIALAHWPQLPAKYKALYINELKLAVNHGYAFNRVFNIASQSNSLAILCLSLQLGTDFEPVRATAIYKQRCENSR